MNITCIQQNVEQLSNNACVLLDALMGGQSIPKKHIVIPTGVLTGVTL